jgi:hypothetical protein
MMGSFRNLFKVEEILCGQAGEAKPEACGSCGMWRRRRRRRIFKQNKRLSISRRSRRSKLEAF